MRKTFMWVSMAVLLFSCGLLAVEGISETPAVHQAHRSLATQPIAFTKNMGQWPDSILFRADIGEAVMWVVRDGIYYQYFHRVVRATSLNEASSPEATLASLHEQFGRERDSVETTMIKAEFAGASPDVKVVGLNELDYKCNYFIGNDPTKWRTDVPNYSSVTFKELYSGVEASIRERDGRLECRLTVVSDAALAQVRTEYRGAGSVTTQTENIVSIQTAIGEKRFSGILPLGETESAGVAIASTQPPNAGVSLLYSTYLGGGGSDECHGIAVDGSGNAYVTGLTSSADFPAQNLYQPDQGGTDIFVTKLSAASNSLLYSTYLGGGGVDAGEGIAVDGSGNAYVVGHTGSTDFPTQSPYQTDQGGTDVFVTKLSAAGNSLLYSTYLGGGGDDYGYGITLDGGGSAYLTGQTYSTNFPTQNPYQTNQAGDDVFITKLSATGNSLLYSTYLGGSSFEQGRGIAVDGSGNAYVTGWTASTNFPTLNFYQTEQNSIDAFVTKLSAAGNSLLYSTYLGGGGRDRGNGITVDRSGNAYVTGWTGSVDFPTENPYQTDQGDYDVFVGKLSVAGNSLLYSTYLGGGGGDYGNGIAVDSSGNTYVTGWTGSVDFPTENPYQTDPGDGTWDVFVTTFSANGNNLLYSTYLGGEGGDYGNGIAVESSGNAYVTGWTDSWDFPTQNPYQTDQSDGKSDGLIAKLMCVPHYGPITIPPANRDVTVDLRPGVCPNPLFGSDLCRGKSVIPVAVQGSADFDVSDIDASSVTLCGVRALEWSLLDVSTPVDKTTDSCACSTDGPDGYPDLLLKFEQCAIESAIKPPPPPPIGTGVEVAKLAVGTGALTIPSTTLSEEPAKPPLVLTLYGMLEDGSPITGYDCLELSDKVTPAITPIDDPQPVGLRGNYPNPFNPTTTISYGVPAPTHVVIELFNIVGQRIRTLVDEPKPSGVYEAVWNGTDNSGQPVSSGVYLYRLRAGDFIETKKMVLLK